MEDLKEIKIMVAELHTFVMGNDKYGQKGLRHTNQETDVRLKELEEHKSKEGKRLAKAGIFGGALGGSIGVLFPKTILAKLWLLLSNIF